MKIEFTPSLKTVNNESIIGTGNIDAGGGSGSVTNVATSAPLSGGPITTTGTISITKASSTTDGYLSSTDWATFNSKQPAGAYLTTVTADSPLSGSGTSASHLAIPAASGSVSGYLSSTDWSTFNNKADASSLGNYVLKAGDTMTGELILPASTSTLIPLHFQQGTTPTTPADGDIWFDQNGMYIQNLSAIHQLDADANAVGALSNATITLGSTTGTINVTSIEVFIYALAGWQGNYMRRTVPAATGLALTDGVANFLVVSYNAGSPIYSITTSASSINNSNVLLVASMWRTGADIHWAVVNWGLATATRLNDRLINIQRYVRSSGLMLGETTGNVITSTSGLIWYGIKAYAQGLQSSSPSNADFYYHSGGVWTHSTVSTYNNTQYDNGTGLVALGPNKFGVNWVYQFVNGDGLPKLAYYLGTASYSTVAAAAGASQPTPPAILTQMGILIGRIIVSTGAATASEIDSAFTTVFAGTAITDHNSLAGLQGGASAQYYHLTSAQYTVATQAATSSANGYLTSTDWTTFNSKQGLTTISTKTANFTVNAENWYINNKTGSTCTVTLPDASANTGRAITFKNLQAQTVISASSNVVPIDSTTAGTAILTNVVGNWATLVSDGSNWVIMQQAPNNILLLE